MTTPNLISLARLFLIPLFVGLLIHQYFLAAAVLLVISAISDLLDGYLARKYNQVTKLGTILDPLADKLLILAGFIYFMTTQDISIGFVCAVFFRDMCLVTGVIALLLFNKKAVVPSLAIGKLSSAISMTFVFFLCLNQVYSYFNLFVAFLYGATLIVIVASFIFYSQRWFWLFEQKEND